MVRAEKIEQLALDAAQKYVTDLWDTYQNATKDRRKNLCDYYKQYRGLSNRKNYQGFADVVVNETLEATEAIVAQIFNTIYSESKYLRVVGREENDQSKEELIEGLMYYLLEEMGEKKKVLRNLRQMVSYGTTRAKLSWKYKKQTMRFMQDGKMVSTDVVTANHPELTFIDLLDIAVDTKPDMEDRKWVIWRKRMTKEDVDNEVRGLRYSAKQAEKLNYKKNAMSEQLYTSKQKNNSGGMNLDFLEEGQVYVLEFWGIAPRWWVDESVDLNSPDAKEWVPSTIEVCGDVVLRMVEEPYDHKEIPFLEGHYIQFDGEPEGIGACEISASLQQELNDKRNQLLDHTSLSIFPPLVINTLSGIRKAMVKILPHFLIESNVSAQNAISAVNIGGSPIQNLQIDPVIKQDIRNMTGATNPVQGIKSSGDTTAYETSVLERRGSSRIGVATVDFGEKFLRRMYMLIFKKARQYITTEMAIRIMGKEGVKWVKVSPQDLLSNFDFYHVIPTDLESRVIIRNQMIQFLQSLASFYPRINVYGIARKIYASFGFSDTDEIIPAPETERGRKDLTDEQELYVLIQGQMIKAKFYDDHLAKLAMLQQYLNSNQQSLSEEARVAFQDKIGQHLSYLKILEEKVQNAEGQSLHQNMPQVMRPNSQPVELTQMGGAR